MADEKNPDGSKEETRRPNGSDVDGATDGFDEDVRRAVELGNRDKTPGMEDLHREEYEAGIRHGEEVHRWREIYLARSFYLVSFVIYISLSFVLLSAIGILNMVKEVQIALLTSMVANVIGILTIAFYWLYGHGHAKEKGECK